ncbi:MAG: hypothetical protein ACYDC9_02860 [Dermatophilaceae bacterium]
MRPRIQGDAAVLAMRFDDGPVVVIDMLADQVGPPGFDPAIASQMSRSVAIRLGMRRSATAETSLVTDLVMGHTSQEALSQWERASDLRRRW